MKIATRKSKYFLYREIVDKFGAFVYAEAILCSKYFFEVTYKWVRKLNFCISPKLI